MLTSFWHFCKLSGSMFFRLPNVMIRSDVCEFHAFWTPFETLLDAFWMPLGCLFEPGTAMGAILTNVCKCHGFRWFSDFAAPPPGISFWCHVDTFAKLLAVAFTCFCWLPFFMICFICCQFWVFPLDSIWHAFWSAWEPRKWSQNVDRSTILTLWTPFFRPDF